MPYSLSQLQTASVDELERILWSERKRLSHCNLTEISTLYLLACHFKRTALVVQLDAELDRAGRTGSMVSSAIQRVSAATNRINPHDQIIEELLSWVDFIVAEEMRLIRISAPEVSTEYLQALATLDQLEQNELILFLQFPRAERDRTFQELPVANSDHRFFQDNQDAPPASQQEDLHSECQFDFDEEDTWLRPGNS